MAGALEGLLPKGASSWSCAPGRMGLALERETVYQERKGGQKTADVRNSQMVLNLCPKLMRWKKSTVRVGLRGNLGNSIFRLEQDGQPTGPDMNIVGLDQRIRLDRGGWWGEFARNTETAKGPVTLGNLLAKVPFLGADTSADIRAQHGLRSWLWGRTLHGGKHQRWDLSFAAGRREDRLEATLMMASPSKGERLLLPAAFRTQGPHWQAQARFGSLRVFRERHKGEIQKSLTFIGRAPNPDYGRLLVQKGRLVHSITTVEKGKWTFTHDRTALNGNGGGVLTLISSVFGFLGGDLLLDGAVDLQLKTLTVNLKNPGQKRRWNYGLSRTAVRGQAAFNGVQKALFGLVSRNPVHKRFSFDSIRVYKLSMSMEQKIRKKLWLSLGLEQAVPTGEVKDLLALPKAPGTPGGPSAPKSKSHADGGRLLTIGLWREF